jgi:hypothetical protein
MDNEISETEFSGDLVLIPKDGYFPRYQYKKTLYSKKVPKEKS